MELLITIAQVIIAITILIVWVFRFDNIQSEFKQYGLSDLTRSMVGATKISLSTLLIVGIWHSEFILIPALGIAFLMLCALYAHFSVRNPIMICKILNNAYFRGSNGGSLLNYNRLD